MVAFGFGDFSELLLTVSAKSAAEAISFEG